MGELTIYQEKLTDFVYILFGFNTPVEQYVGMVEFPNTDRGWKYHSLFVDFCFDYNIGIKKGDYENWLEINSIRTRNYELFRNYSGYVVKDLQGYEVLIGSLEEVARQIVNIENPNRRGKKTSKKNP
jgi:hypothetical protein